MFKSLISFTLKLLVAVAPLTFILFPQWWKPLWKDVDSAKVETIAALSVLDLVVLTVYEIFSRLLPQKEARELSQLFVKTVFDEFETEANAIGLRLGDDIRINMMFAKRLPVLLLIRRFAWFANRGFDGRHRDNLLGLFTWQGLCGKAFRSRESLGVDLRNVTVKKRYPCTENFWLFPWQVANTAHLKAIISIPIFWEIDKGQLKKHKAVGVINLDAVSDIGADGLLSNKTRLDTFFKKYGKLLAICSSR